MTEQSMTKSELIERIVEAQTMSSGSQLTSKDVELAVKTMLEQMSHTLAAGDRIEIRGFGSFSLHYRAPRIGRNPKTGESVGLAGKYVPHFKPGKELRDRVNLALQEEMQRRAAGDVPGTSADSAEDADEDVNSNRFGPSSSGRTGTQAMGSADEGYRASPPSDDLFD